MKAEVTILAILLVVVWHLVKPFSKQACQVIWAVVLIWIVGMLAAHDWAQSHYRDGIIIDSSVDAMKYYDTAIDVEGDATRRRISDSSGSTQHLGYYYLNIAAATVSERPMLALRLFKLALFMLSLLCLARMWRSHYGERLAILGLLYMALGHWEFFHNNFRNFKDGVIASLVMLFLALVESPYGPADVKSQYRNRPQATLRWILIAGTLAGLFTLRSYLAVAMAASFFFALLFARDRMTASGAIRLAAVGGLSLLLFANLSIWGLAAYYADSLLAEGPIEIGTNILKALASPIPWNHLRWFLIPSHCLYLLVLPIAICACIVIFRRRLLWQVMFVAFVIISNTLLGDAMWRKRLCIIPFFITWILAERFEHQQVRLKEQGK